MQIDNRGDMEKKKLIRYEKLFRQATSTRNYSSRTTAAGLFRFNVSPCDKPKRVLIALVCCEQYMAVSMPGHGDLAALMSQMASSSTRWVPTV